MTVQEQLNMEKYRVYGGYDKFVEIVRSDMKYEEKAMRLAGEFKVTVSTGRKWMSAYKRSQLDGITH